MHIYKYKKILYSVFLATFFLLISSSFGVKNSFAFCRPMDPPCFAPTNNLCQNDGNTYCCSESSTECQPVGGDPAGTIDNIDGVATIAGIDDLFQNVLAVVLEIAAVVLFLMLIAGGFRYLTSGGNPKMTEGAKHTITYAILGMILVASAFLIIQLLEDFTGAPLTEFSVVGP